MKSSSLKSLNFAFAIVLGLTGLMGQRTEAQSGAQSSLLAAVDPMIGTANDGNTYPGATVPYAADAGVANEAAASVPSARNSLRSIGTPHWLDIDGKNGWPILTSRLLRR